MLLYKFKPLDNIDYVQEMICDRKFYCASLKELNDPMEGVFHYYDLPGYQPGMDQLMEAKRAKRVCSFSKNGMNPIMWAHYSKGMTGACVVINIESCQDDFKKISYQENPPDNISPGSDPNDILTRKLGIWEYEREYRRIQPEKYYLFPAGIDQLYVGEHADPRHKSVLRSVCNQRSIAIKEAAIKQEQDQKFIVTLRDLSN